MAIEEEFTIVSTTSSLHQPTPILRHSLLTFELVPIQQEIPDEEADNITTVQQAIDYIAKSPEAV